MSLFECHKEKEMDSRFLDRKIKLGQLDAAQLKSYLDSLPDDAERADYSNVDELMAKDNPVHVPRNLPSIEDLTPRNLEELELEESGTFQFEN